MDAGGRWSRSSTQQLSSVLSAGGHAALRGLALLADGLIWHPHQQLCARLRRRTNWR